MSHEEAGALIEQLRHGLVSMDDKVRVQSARRLQQIPSYIDAIESDLASNDPDVRSRAALRLQALAVYGDGADLWPLTARWCTCDDPETRELVAQMVLGPLLDHNFDSLFPGVETLALSDARFAEVALESLDWAAAGADEKRKARIESLTQRLYAAGVPRRAPPTEPTLEQILDDDNPFFEDDLMHHLLGRPDHTSGERAAYLVLLLSIQVADGGFWQFYYNAAEGEPAETPAALGLIGAKRHAELVAEANSVFGSQGPPADTARRRSAIEALGESARRRWRELDRLFYALPTDLGELLRRYITTHESEFCDEASD